MRKNHNWIVLTIFIVVGFLFLGKFILNPAFHLIDDGSSLKVSREVLEGKVGSLVEHQNGRIRVVYWMYFILLQIIFGLNPLGYWIGQLIIITLLLFVLYKTLMIGTNGKGEKVFMIFNLALLCSLFFVPAVSENIYRLGTAEIRQSLMVFWFIYFVLSRRRKIWSSIDLVNSWIIMMFAFLTKETSLMIILFLLISELPSLLSERDKSQKFRENRIKILTILGLSAILFYGAVKGFSEFGSYSSSFSISLDHLRLRLLMTRVNYSEIFYLLILLSASTSFRLLINLRKYFIESVVEFINNNTLVLISAVGVACSLFFVFSWPYELERYYFLTYLFLATYLSSELRAVYTVFKKNKSKELFILYIIGGLLLSILSFYTIFKRISPNINSYWSRSKEISRVWQCDYLSGYSLIQYLKTHPNNSYYVDSNDYEVVYQIGVFNYLWNGDTVIYTSIKDLTEKYVPYKYVNSPGNERIITFNNSQSELDPSSYQITSLTHKMSDNCQDRLEWEIWSKL